jgi:cyclopropane fatty-acyl-phospholipid synthase-like methyltransferase
MSDGAPARDRAPVEHFERLARDSADPWDYETSDYEQSKYRRTLEFLPEATGATLEIGCSIGVFTAMLAPRCASLLAVDFSPTALERARRRLDGADAVEFRRAELPEETPAGPFDTIVAAEVLYYWSPELVREGLKRLEAALAPGGTLLAIHWRPGDSRRELNGDDVHAILRQRTTLRRESVYETRDYLLDCWSKS